MKKKFSFQAEVKQEGVKQINLLASDDFKKIKSLNDSVVGAVIDQAIDAFGDDWINASYKASVQSDNRITKDKIVRFSKKNTQLWSKTLFQLCAEIGRNHPFKVPINRQISLVVEQSSISFDADRVVAEFNQNLVAACEEAFGEKWRYTVIKTIEDKSNEIVRYNKLNQALGEKPLYLNLILLILLVLAEERGGQQIEICKTMYFQIY
ncbi:MAG: hypothetical protein ACK5M0_04490 [Bacteroidales bacterium]